MVNVNAVLYVAKVSILACLEQTIQTNFARQGQG